MSFERTQPFSDFLGNYRIVDSELPPLERVVAYQWVAVRFKIVGIMTVSNKLFIHRYKTIYIIFLEYLITTKTMLKQGYQILIFL